MTPLFSTLFLVLFPKRLNRQCYHAKYPKLTIFKKTFQMLAVLTAVIFGVQIFFLGKSTVTDDEIRQTIDQIHREVHKEREEQERELNNPQFQGPMGSMGGPSRDGRMGDRRGGDDRNRKQSRKLTFFILYLFKRE